MQGIEIPIGAPLGKLDKDVDGAKKILKGFTVAANGDLLSIGKSLGTLERQLKVFKEGIKNSTDPRRILLLNNAIKATEAQLAGTKNAINGVGFNKFSAGSNEAAFALTNLGRVAQDAPFGFIGIQNNLNPLLESFQRLRSENTSLGATFKALGSSLIGPAGLGIALSLVTAAFTFYTIYAQKAKKETKELASATDSLTDSAAQEIAKVTLLYDASQNLNIPLKQRQKIVDELQKQFPQTFGNLSDEAILAGKAKTAYEGLTQAIINSAVVRGGEDLIASKVKILAASLIAFQDQQRKLSDATKGKGFLSKSNSFNVDKNGDLETLNDYETRIKKEILDVRKSVQGAIGNFSAESIIGNVGGNKIDKSNKGLKTQADILKALDIDFKQIAADQKLLMSGKFIEQTKATSKAINDLIGIGVSTDSGIIKKLQQDLLVLDKSELLLTGKQLGLNLIQGVQEGVSGISGQVGTQITEDLVEGFNRGAPVIAKTIGNSLKIPLTDFQIYVNEELLPKLQTNFETFFNDILMNGKLSFDSLGKALINTLLSVIASDAARQVTSLLKTSSGQDSSDSKKDGGGGLLAGVFGLLKGAKKAAPLVTTAATTTAATGGTAALATGTAATGGALLPILAGVAAVASIASLFKKKKQAPIPQASSTISTSAAGSAQDFGGGRVVFEISGTNLIGVLNRAGAKLQRFGP